MNEEEQRAWNAYKNKDFYNKNYLGIRLKPIDNNAKDMTFIPKFSFLWLNFSLNARREQLLKINWSKGFDKIVERLHGK